MKEQLWKNILLLKEKSPLIHNITNYVVMNNTANALLASGASPVMAHAQAEVENMCSIAQAVVINIGTLEEYWVESMLKTARVAQQNKIPWVLDPVGAGATTYRNKVLSELLALSPQVIRGNASEIIALATQNTSTKGVDSTAESNQAIAAAKQLVKMYACTVCISGATDIIINESTQIQLNNGDPIMEKVTGMGCTASALTAAFCGVTSNYFIATTTAMALLGVAGSLAAKKSQGPGSFQVHLLDVLYTITEKEFINNLQLTTYE